ncbi:MAG: hypothetical protein JWR63_1192 [Conexibacter sp.]|nr:hypothetical protein [Conexibacter sp.]
MTVSASLVPVASGVLVRAARGSDPFKWRNADELLSEQDLAAAPELSGNRFDSPTAEFRTLYFASEPYGCHLETMSRFRPLSRLEAAIVAAVDDDSDPEHEFPFATGKVPAEWIQARILGRVSVNPEARFVDLEDAKTLTWLQAELGVDWLKPWGLDRFDRGVALNRDRALTRRLAAEIRDRLYSDAVGIRYTSVHDQSAVCFAAWENIVPMLNGHRVEPVDPAGSEIKRAADALGIELPNPPDPVPPIEGVAPW